MLRILSLLFLLTAGTGAALNAQDSPLDSREDEFPGAISTLLDLHEELGLTPVQIDSLLAIEKRLDTTVEPLVERTVELWRLIRALGPEEELTPDARTLFDSYVAEMKPLMKTVQDYTRSAMTEVGAVLTDSQKDAVARILKEWEATQKSSGDAKRLDPGG